MSATPAVRRVPASRAVIGVAALIATLGGFLLAIPAVLRLNDPFVACWAGDGPTGSEAEAREKLKEFFIIGGWEARDLLAELHRDGMTDSYAARLREGCRDCDVHPGQKYQSENFTSWYFTVKIEQTKIVILRLDCAASVALEIKLYGR